MSRSSELRNALDTMLEITFPKAKFTFDEILDDYLDAPEPNDMFYRYEYEYLRVKAQIVSDYLFQLETELKAAVALLDENTDEEKIA